MAGATRLSSLAGVPSGATVIICTTPAVAAAGEAMPKGREFEDAPEAGSYTEMFTVPGAATRALVTVAARPALVPNCVGKALPFHSTTEVLGKPVPVARSVKPGVPATIQLFPSGVALYGPTRVNVIFGGGMIILVLPLLPPPQPGKLKTARPRAKTLVVVSHR
jgi:hypothetical protein